MSSNSISRRQVLAASLGALGLAAPRAQAQGSAPRVALVIGNAAYALGPLANPGNDARVMAGLLREIGFQVVEARDAGKAQMEAAIQQAGALMKGRNGVGLLYYAGHGLQLDWRNYMLPVDVSLTRAADVPEQAVDVQSVLGAFGSAGNRMNILVLDACRNNPFTEAGSGRGLAPMDAPPGTFFAYATAPGNVAEDGTAQDGHGLYTRFLAQEMRRKDARIEDVFKRVRLQVRQASHGRQIPWESTSLEDDFVFATGQKVEAPGAAARDADFDAEKSAWDRIKASRRPEDFFDFLQRFPNGSVSELAHFRLDQLARPVAQSQATVTTLAAGVDRFKVGDAWAMQRTDFLKAGAVTESRSRVTAIEAGRVIVNNGGAVFDQMGGVLLNRFGAKDPAVVGAPAGLQVGKRWRSAFSNTHRPGDAAARNHYEHRVVALEELEVPAGRYRAYRIEAKGESIQHNHARRLYQMYWVDPATMLMLRIDTKQTAFAGDEVLVHVSETLLWRRLVPRA